MNTLTQYPIPQWISVAFLIAIPLPFILILAFIRAEVKKTTYKLAYPISILFFALYLSYIALASYKGLFNEVSLPPKVLLLTTFPFAFLLFAIVLNTKIYKNIVQNSALENLVALHIFRVIGVFFVLLAVHHALPKPFAFVAGIGDMLTAVSSLFVVKAIRDKKSYAKRLTYWWNIFHLRCQSFTLISS